MPEESDNEGLFGQNAISQSDIDEIISANPIDQVQIDDLIPQNLLELEDLERVVSESTEYFERTQELASEHITVDYPWNYDPERYESTEQAKYHAFKWHFEARERLANSDDQALEIFAERMAEVEAAFDDELDTGKPLYKILYLLISTQDGLITWLCEQHPDLNPDNIMSHGEELYETDTKQDCIEEMYDEYSAFDVEEGHAFRAKWRAFWHHRHRIMHGHPDAFYDENIVLASMYFTGLIAHVVLGRLGDIRNEEFVGLY